MLAFVRIWRYWVMASDWEVVKLKNAAQFFSGGTPPKSQPEYWGGDIPWISAKSMKGSRYHDSDLKLTEAGLKKGSRLAPKNSILLLVRGSMLHQKIPVGIATKDVAFNQDVKAIIPNEKFLPLYFYYCFAGRENELLAKVENTGIGAGKLDTDVLNKIEFYCPPIAEQKSIAHILGSLDDKIELNRQMNDTLEAMAQALFKSWFVDFDPVIDNALAAGNAIPDEFAERAEQRKGIEKKDNSNIQDLFPDEFEFTEEMDWIPKGWVVEKLEQKIDVLNGFAFKSKDYVEKGLFVLRTKNFTSQGGVELLTDDVYLPNEFKNTFSKYLSEPFDYHLIMVGASVGNRGLIEPHQLPALRNQNMWCFRPKPNSEISKSYVKYMLDFITPQKLGLASGSAREFFRKGDFQTHQLCLPSNAVLNTFDQIAFSYLKKQAQNNAENVSLSKIRDILLPKLMSGELRISDAAALVEEI